VGLSGNFIDFRKVLNYSTGMDIKLAMLKLRESGLTQRGIARALGFSPAHVYLLAHGKAGTRPSYRLMSALQKLLTEKEIDYEKL